MTSSPKLMAVPDTNGFFEKDQNLRAEYFEIIKLLGQGSFGKVYQSYNKKTFQLVAIKVINKEVMKRKKQLTYAVREKEVMQMLDHPFIIKLYQAFQTPKFIYLIMDYVEYGDLLMHIIDRNQLEEEEAKFYSAQLILAIEYLHNQDIIYRDLKPENILLDRKGNIKLIDFGLAKQLSSS